MDHQTTTGDRVRDVRKRRGLGQRQLSDLSGVSFSLVRKLEQGNYGTVRLKTLHKLAVTLRIPTTTLAARPDAVEPGSIEVEQWQEARRALEGRPEETPPEEQPTVDGIAAAGRLAVTAYIMAQTWQFDSAGHAIELASDDAGDGLTVKAVLDWKCWVLLRQGALAQARDLATHWSDAAEPRLSRASREELAAWGRFLLRLSTAAARDNRPGEAKDALKLARVAAVAAGNDFILPYNPWQAFGPMAVSMIQAENATIQDRPDITLAIAVQLQGRRFPVPRLYHRHRLDVAHAHTAMRQHSEAVTVLHEIRRDAPEWLAQQRYARDILSQIIGRRRTLTPEMRDLADFLHLAL